ncbi:hypothetical protein LPA07_17300 [Lactiplantibacillus paraplantarum]|nr:hypothetical protein LPA07_17300 [Lactiplantibacillus paraplantarum]
MAIKRADIKGPDLKHFVSSQALLLYNQLFLNATYPVVLVRTDVNANTASQSVMHLKFQVTIIVQANFSW